VFTRKIFVIHRGRNPKRAHFRHPTGPPHSSSPRTSLLFCRKMSPTQKITTVTPGCHLLSSSYLNNHSAALRKINEKLATPVEVQSKSHRLLPRTKSVMDYNVLLAEIQNTKLADRTYPLPDASRLRLVSKAFP
jgi:hypothetical protein